MPQTPIGAGSRKVVSRTRALGSVVRVLTLAGATLATGLVAGVFYAYAVSVNLGLAQQPDASYVAAMQTINERIQNPLFFVSFFGAVPALLGTLVIQHTSRPRSGRLWLVALACALYLGGSPRPSSYLRLQVHRVQRSPGEVSEGYGHDSGVPCDADLAEELQPRRGRLVPGL